MKVRMNVDISGGRADGRPWPPRGGEIEVSDAEGAELCRADPHMDAPLAVPVVEERAVETADAPPAEVRAAGEPAPVKRGPGRPRKDAAPEPAPEPPASFTRPGQ